MEPRKVFSSLASRLNHGFSLAVQTGLGVVLSTILVAGVFAAPDKCDPWPACNKEDPGGGGGAGDILGTDGPDDLCSLATPGDDVVKGFLGDDVLCGEGGNDRLEGGGGNDTLDGGPGDDGLLHDAGDDWVDAGDGDDFVAGHDGADWIDCGGGRDRINYNGNGIAIFVNSTAGPITRTIDGVEYTVGPHQILERVSNITANVSNCEIYTGSPGDDYMFGGPANEALDGRRGDDWLDGGEGDDEIRADRGNDIAIGGPGNDSLRGGDHQDAFLFSSLDFTSNEIDSIEDFNPKFDCIALGDLVALSFDTTQDLDGDPRTTDTLIEVAGAGGAGHIEVWDAVLSPAGLGCP